MLAKQTELHCNHFPDTIFILHTHTARCWWLFNCETCSLAAAHGLIYRSISFYYSCHFFSSLFWLFLSRLLLFHHHIHNVVCSAVQRHHLRSRPLIHSLTLASSAFIFINFCIYYDFFCASLITIGFSSFIIYRSYVL